MAPAAKPGEFDFDSMNGKFDKDRFFATIAQKEQQALKISAGYNKTSSFFDEISCEAQEVRRRRRRRRPALAPAAGSGRSTWRRGTASLC